MKQIEIKIIASATYFAVVSRKVSDIAQKFDVDKRTIRRYSEHPLWHKTLDTIGYTGIRSFDHQPNRDVVRDTDGLYEAAKEAYTEAAERGEPKHRLARIGAQATGVETRKVRDWAKKYKWRS